MTNSAAKAPYRATFRVQTVGIEQVERCADPDYELMQDLTNQYSQMAIFKVGDDVRQVRFLPLSEGLLSTDLFNSNRIYWHCN